MKTSQLMLERRHSYLSEPLLVDNYHCDTEIEDQMLSSSEDGEWMEYPLDDDNHYPKITDI